MEHPKLSPPRDSDQRSSQWDAVSTACQSHLDQAWVFLARRPKVFAGTSSEVPESAGKLAYAFSGTLTPYLVG